MKTLFSTALVGARDGFDYWRSVCQEAIVDHYSTPKDRHAFSASLQLGSVAGVGLVVADMSGMTVERTCAHAGNADPDELLLSTQPKGVIRTMRGEERSSLEAGDVGLFDPRAAFCNSFSDGSRHIVAKLSRRELNARLGAPIDAPLLKIPKAPGLAGVLSDLLLRLPEREAHLDDVAAWEVRELLVDLAAATIVNTLGREVPGELRQSRSLVLLRLRGAIDALLTDPRLTDAEAAAAAGVSLRHANIVLAGEGTTLDLEIRTARLEKCRQALEDPLQDGVAPSDLALRWGFSDQTQFYRAFRAAYGLSPGDYRRVSRFR